MIIIEFILFMYFFNEAVNSLNAVGHFGYGLFAFMMFLSILISVKKKK